MAFTYLDSQMIEIPASIAQLSAENLFANNFTVNNLQGTIIQTPTFGNAALWYLAYIIVATRNGFWDSTYSNVTALSTNWTSTFNTVCALSTDWNSTYNVVKALSSTWTSVTDLSTAWQSTYTTVNALSNAWEESADIVPTVTNYLSNNNVDVKDISFPQNGGLVFNNAEIFGNVVIHGTLSALSGAQIFEGLTTTVASSLSVQNFGPGPALYVFQDACLESVAVFKCADESNILTINNTIPDQDQDSVKIYFTGNGNTLVVGNSANSSVFVVTSAGNTNTTGQILSGNIPLHNIFLTSETDSQTLSFSESSLDLTISNGNTVNLSAINTTVAANSANWESTYNTTNTLSANWDSVYQLTTQLSSFWQSTYEGVSSLSANWEESLDITSITTLVSINSANWESTYSTVCSISANWESVYNGVGLLSANWESTYSTVCSISANWEIAYAAISSLSASWEESEDILAISTLVSVNSGNWESTYATVCSLSASWEESASIIPTTTNYLSTNVITISSLTVIDTLTSNNIILPPSTIPTLSTDTGSIGTFKWDTEYLYICVDTNTWKRVALSGWN